MQLLGDAMLQWMTHNHMRSLLSDSKRLRVLHAFIVSSPPDIAQVLVFFSSQVLPGAAEINAIVMFSLCIISIFMCFIIADGSISLKSVALLVNSLILVIPLCNLLLIPFLYNFV